VRAGAGAYDVLLRQGVIVRPMGGFGLPEHVRITIGTRAENERAVRALRALRAAA
jgi:histidinol-phosphate aminotransferase